MEPLNKGHIGIRPCRKAVLISEVKINQMYIFSTDVVLISRGSFIRGATLSCLQDPSRNHSVLRALVSKLAPPVIPFMPLVTKDAYFLHIGNDTYVGDLVNFEKMRLVASNVMALNRLKTGSLPQELRITANKNPDLQQYIR